MFCCFRKLTTAENEEKVSKIERSQKDRIDSLVEIEPTDLGSNSESTTTERTRKFQKLANSSITAERIKTAYTGSIWKEVPGILVPLGTTVPGTIGSMRALHSGETLNPSRPQPIVSMRQRRAVE